MADENKNQPEPSTSQATAPDAAPVPAQPAPDAASPAGSPEPRRHRATDPDRRRKRAGKEAVRRAVEQLKEANSVEELDRLLEKRSRKRGQEPAEDAPPAGDVSGEQSAASAPDVPLPAEPGQLPGWPAPSAIAAAKPTAAAIWATAAKYLAGSPFAIDAPRAVDMGDGEKIEVSPMAMLVDGTAPLLAKHMKPEKLTPEIAFLGACVLVFGPPALETLLAKRKAVVH